MMRLLPLFVLALSQGRGQPRQVNSVVHVEGRTATADRIEKIDVVLTPISGGPEHKGSGQTVELSVPTGDYILRVDGPGFEGRRQMLRVYQPETFRTVT